jgi:hypothetical protein
VVVVVAFAVAAAASLAFIELFHSHLLVILLPGAPNATVGSAEIHNIVGNYREPVTNTNGLKPRDVAVALV